MRMAIAIARLASDWPTMCLLRYATISLGVMSLLSWGSTQGGWFGKCGVSQSRCSSTRHQWACGRHEWVHAAGKGAVRSEAVRLRRGGFCWRRRGSDGGAGKAQQGRLQHQTPCPATSSNEMHAATHLALRLLCDFDRHGLLGRLLHAGRRRHGPDGAHGAVVDVVGSPPPILRRHHHARNGCRGRGAGKDPSTSRGCKSSRHGSCTVHCVVVVRKRRLSSSLEP